MASAVAIRLMKSCASEGREFFMDMCESAQSPLNVSWGGEIKA